MIKKENRSKVYLLIIAILLVANIALLSFLLMKKGNDKPHSKRPDRGAMISGFLKTEIGFDAAQLEQYDTLSARHKENMKIMFDSLRSSKDKQFKQLTAGNFSDSAMSAVAEQSAASQKMVEWQMFTHLKNIRMLCKPEQLAAFDSLFAKILNRKGPDNKGDERKKTSD